MGMPTRAPSPVVRAGVLPSLAPQSPCEAGITAPTLQIGKLRLREAKLVNAQVGIQTQVCL